jgi:hypothetical protein
MAPRSLVDIYRRFGGAYCLHYRPGDGSSKLSEMTGDIAEDSHLQTKKQSVNLYSKFCVTESDQLMLCVWVSATVVFQKNIYINH